MIKLQSLAEDLLGADLPIGFRAYDGSRMGPSNPTASIVVHSSKALRYIATSPGQLGFARAYITGEVDLEGDIYEIINIQSRLPIVKLNFAQFVKALKILGLSNLRPLPTPPEEIKKQWGWRHSLRRDSATVSHHYDVSNAFYRLVLGPSMTYSCAVFESKSDTLEKAQENKYELICKKLGLKAGERLLDIGCGWGSMAIHAARHYGVNVVAVTVSKNQMELARQRVAEEGLSEQVEIRLQDYREIDDGPFDAVSSIGMFEHVGLAQIRDYFSGIYALLAPGGRLLNHAISRWPGQKARMMRGGFMDHYVFPDAEVHEVGTVISSLQQVGFEARHMEDLREHYALTLQHWVKNLENNWAEAVATSSEARARIWKLYMAGCATIFAQDRLRIHQVLAVKNRLPGGTNDLPLRPNW